MKLKPGLLQLIVTLMTVSLLASCTASTNQSYCDNPQTAQQAEDCDNGSNHYGTSRYRSGTSRTKFGNSSRSKTGRGGFGSFGRGSSAGG